MSVAGNTLRACEIHAVVVPGVTACGSRVPGALSVGMLFRPPRALGGGRTAS